MQPPRPLPLLPLLTLLLAGCAPLPAADSGAAAADGGAALLDRELVALTTDPQRPLLAVAALAIREGRIVHANQFGWRHLGDAGAPPLPVTGRTLFRVASISKLVVAVGVMRLVEQGLLDLDADVSELLGWTLRHPWHPQVPITLRLLLSHRSGLSDGGERYAFDGGTRLQDVLQPGGAHFANGLNWNRELAPGSGFAYVNLNFGVVAQLMERATGERFDRLMQRLVLQPLGLRGGFDPSSFAPADQADIATLYRRRRMVDGREVWDPAGPWVVQADDFRQAPPQPPAGLSRYVIGSNGSLFGPQGRLRISVQDLGTLMLMLINEGRHAGRAFLQPASVALLASEQWRQAGPPPEGESVGACAWGLGGQRFTDRAEAGCGDRLVDGGGLVGWGHTGNAYGLKGLFVLDPQRRHGLVLLLAGPGADPATFPGHASALDRWQELAATAVARRLRLVETP
jgi:CubicO group peptidase (beta-lactamase class C family)